MDVMDFFAGEDVSVIGKSMDVNGIFRRFQDKVVLLIDSTLVLDLSPPLLFALTPLYPIRSSFYLFLTHFPPPTPFHYPKRFSSPRKSLSFFFSLK